MFVVTCTCMYRYGVSLYNTAPLPPKKTATEGDDQTGDSGMGTGSGSADYVLNEWRQALTHPPPGILVDECT